MLVRIKQFIKTVLGRTQNTSNTITWTEYNSYNTAKAVCAGYEADNILEKVKESLLKVKTGEAVYERDSFIFNEIQHNWPLIASLEKIAIENEMHLNVIDFGGSLGSTYFYVKQVLPKHVMLEWSIVEQPHFVQSGKDNFESEQLKFYPTVEECVQEKGKPNVLLLSGVLQCLPEPEQFMAHLASFKFDYILIDRTSFIEGDNQVWTIQKVPDWIYKAEYPICFFNEHNFINQFKKYRLEYTFESAYDPKQVIYGRECTWKGMFLKRI